MSYLRGRAFAKKHSLSFFIQTFESRLVNILLRTKMVFNPQILPSLFKLGAISVSNNIITYPQYLVKPFDVIFLNPVLIPYSFYRYFYSKFRVQLISSDLLRFNSFLNLRDKTIMM
jgi:hypothetical protein